MNKVIIYTSNLGFTPKSLAEVIDFAKSAPKFYIAEVGLNSYLSNVKVGDNLITKKGNSIYVIKAFDKSVDDLSYEDREYIDDLTRNYGLKKTNITSVANRIKYETWCPIARPLLNTETKTKNMKNNFSGSIADRIKAMYMPQEVEDVKISLTGDLVVKVGDSYNGFNAAGELVSYDEAFTIDVPVFTVAKPAEQIAVGDIIARDKSYAKVVGKKDGKITVRSFNGTKSNVLPIKDFLMGAAQVRVVMSLTGTFNGQFNPLMLAALGKSGKKGESLLPLMLMSQNNGAIAQNPLALLAFAGDDLDTKDLLLASALSGGQGFGGLFAAPAAPAAAQAVPDENVNVQDNE